MEVVDTVQGVREARGRVAGPVGLVPTMGSLHEGHLALVRRARRENGLTAVSIFVNPSQFGPGEDLGSYPRDMDRDLGLLTREGVDLVFAPSPEEMYPAGFDTWIQVKKTSEVLEGAARPGHFQGVATVVAKLFNIVRPHRAYFGQKDGQQAGGCQPHGEGPGHGRGNRGRAHGPGRGRAGHEQPERILDARREAGRPGGLSCALEGRGPMAEG